MHGFNHSGIEPSTTHTNTTYTWLSGLGMYLLCSILSLSCYRTFQQPRWDVSIKMFAADCLSKHTLLLRQAIQKYLQGTQMISTLYTHCHT